MGQDLEIFYNRYDDKLRAAGLTDADRRLFEDRFHSSEQANIAAKESIHLLNVQIDKVNETVVKSNKNMSQFEDT